MQKLGIGWTYDFDATISGSYGKRYIRLPSGSQYTFIKNSADLTYEQAFWGEGQYYPTVSPYYYY